MIPRNYNISLESFLELAGKCKNDPEDMQNLMCVLETFEEYHRAIIRESSFYSLFVEASGDSNSFIETYQTYDAARSTARIY